MTIGHIILAILIASLLKIVGVLSWSWWVILGPLWLPTAVITTLILLIAFFK